MIIDVHAHAYAFKRRVTCHISGVSFLTAAELIEYMDSKDIDKAVIQPLNSSETPSEPQSIGEVLEICDMFPGRFIPFCSPEPRQPIPDHQITVSLFVKMLEEYKQLGCKGVGEFIPRLPWNDFRVERLLEACGKTQMPVVFHTTTHDTGCYGLLDYIGLPLLENALAKFPDTILVGHSPAFWSEISGDVDPNTKHGYVQGPVTDGGAVVRLMRNYPNLYCDLSAGSGCNAITRDKEFTWGFLKEFQDRLMFGQDICSPAQMPGMLQKEFLTEALEQGNITRDIYDKIMWRNADRILGLNLEKQGKLDV